MLIFLTGELLGDELDTVLSDLESFHMLLTGLLQGLGEERPFSVRRPARGEAGESRPPWREDVEEKLLESPSSTIRSVSK